MTPYASIGISTLVAAISAILPVQAQIITQPSPGEEEVAYLSGGERIILRWIPSGSDTIGTTPEKAKRLLVLGAHKTEVEGEQLQGFRIVRDAIAQSGTKKPVR